MRAESELEQIAKDLASGKIFSDWQIPNDDDVWKIFQAINMMTPQQRADLATMDIGMMYEYKTAAVDSSDGIPIFATMNILTTEEADWVRERFLYHYERLRSG